MVQSSIIASPHAQLDVIHAGSGPVVLCLPGAGRPASDFVFLIKALAAKGYCGIALNPRGIGKSTPLAMNNTLAFSIADYEQDILAVIKHFGSSQPVTLVGHALGQRMARYIAQQHPDIIDALVMLAPGSKTPSGSAEFARFFECLAGDQRSGEFLDALQASMFAKGNSASCWQSGWSTAAAFAQGAAVQSIGLSDYWHAGTANLLAISGEQDIAAGSDLTKELSDDFSQRIKIHRITNAGHALLPEQPAAIAEHVLGWLKEQHR